MIDRDYDSADMARRGRIGAYVQHARHDTQTTTQAGRAAFMSRFADGIPTDLPADERERRIAAARRAHFARLARLSVVSRQQRALARESAR